MEDMKFLDNKLWRFDEATKQVRIGTKEDNYNHLVLSIKRVDSGINVYFSDTPIYLTLKKEWLVNALDEWDFIDQSNKAPENEKKMNE